MMRLALVAAALVLIECHSSSDASPDAAPVVPPASSSSAASRAAAASAPLVLIYGFDNKTADGMLDGTLDEVLVSALSRSPVLYPLASSSMRAFVAAYDGTGKKPLDDALAKSIVDKTSRPVTTVRGAIAPEGTGYTIQMTAKDGASGSVVLTQSVSAASSADVVPMMTHLGTALRRALGDIPSRQDGDVVGVSSSVEADHDYARATALIATGNLSEALPFMEHAVSSDPTFAEAQAALGVLLSNAGRATEGREHLAAALQHVERLSDRERLLLLGYAYFAQDELVPAARAYEELLKRWPAELRYLSNLAALYFRAGKLPRAVDIAREATRDNPLRSVGWVNLVEYETVAGAFDAAIDHAGKANALFPRPAPALPIFDAVALLLKGRRTEALATLGALRAIDATSAASAEADLAAYEGRLADAATLLRAGIAADEAAHANETSLAKWATLGEVLERGGDTVAARSAAVAASKADELVSLYRAGRLLAKGGGEDGAAVRRKLAERGGIHAQVFGKLLEAAAAGDAKPADAVAPLQAAAKLGDYWLVHLELGRAYVAAQAWTDAERELSACMARSSEAAAAFLDDTVTLHYLADAMYLLARAQDEQHKAEAVVSYKALLALTPPGVAAQKDMFVADARKRLAGRK